jgi:uroporphyrinogen decarboxylase
MKINPSLIRVLNGETVYPPPLWMMRQAGRYLQEYTKTRKKAGSFLDLCYNVELATKVTLQPIERFDFDGAILFSDILIVPHALGRNLTFSEGIGPQMDPITPQEIYALEPSLFHVNLKPVYDIVTSIRSKLDISKALIGFCGAPWTVATYMIAGKGTPDQMPARVFAYHHPKEFDHLLSLLVDCSADYLIRQLDAGADVVQIFDSWSGVLDEMMFERACILPVMRMVKRIRMSHPKAKIIGFPKGCGALLRNYRSQTGVDALGLDWGMPQWFMRDMQREGAVQGNLDPLRLLAGGDALDKGVEYVLRTLKDGPFIFNLGHGITPETSIKHVERMVDLVRRG